MSNAELIKDARKAQKAVYLAGPESVAEDLHRIIKGLADALEAAEQQLAVAQAVIAEANGVLSWMPDHDGDDLARVEQDYMHRAQVADEAYSILSQSPADALQAHDREVAAKAKAAIIQRLRDTAHSCRPDSTHNAVADWLEREDFGVPVGTEKEGDRG